LSVLLGTLVTLVAVLRPARRATRVSALVALTGQVADSSDPRRRRRRMIRVGFLASLILVAGPRWRSLSAWVGALFTAAMGYSTLVNQWHRPGDVIAAILLAAAWGCAAIACGAWRRDVDGGLEPVRLTGLGSLALLGVVCALVGAGLEVRTWRDAAELAGRTDTFLADAASSAGTLAVACLSMAAIAALTSVGSGRR